MLILSAFVLLRKGVLVEMAFADSKYAKAPKYPLKLAGALSLSSAIFLSAYFGEYNLISSAMLASAILGGWYLYYGFDPRVDKIKAYSSDASAQRILALIAESQKRVENIYNYAQKTPSKDVAHLMHEVADGFNNIIEHIEIDPDDYNLARKYLVSYLVELESMSEHFSKLDIKERTQEMKEEFVELLNTTIEKLNKQYKKLVDDDILDLDIKMSVMKKRFKNEE